MHQQLKGRDRKSSLLERHAVVDQNIHTFVGVFSVAGTGSWIVTFLVTLLLEHPAPANHNRYDNWEKRIREPSHRFVGIDPDFTRP